MGGGIWWGLGEVDHVKVVPRMALNSSIPFSINNLKMALLIPCTFLLQTALSAFQIQTGWIDILRVRQGNMVFVET